MEHAGRTGRLACWLYAKRTPLRRKCFPSADFNALLRTVRGLQCTPAVNLHPQDAGEALKSIQNALSPRQMQESGGNRVRSPTRAATKRPKRVPLSRASPTTGIRLKNPRFGPRISHPHRIPDRLGSHAADATIGRADAPRDRNGPIASGQPQ